LKSDFFKRITTSAVFVIILIGSTLLHPVSFFIVFLAIVAIGQAEFYKIALRDGRKPQVITGIFFGSVIFITNFLVASGNANMKIFAAYLPIVIAITIIELFRDSVHPVSNISYAIFGALYVAMPFSLVNYMMYFPAFNNEFNGSILIAFFVLIWASDSGAYIIGSMIGKNKLFERISPKKTWEGFLGGALFSLIAAWLVSIFIKEISIIHWLNIAILTAVFGTFGDLLESLLKRKVNIKDSGTLLPGHGGILDRFDSLLMAAPIVYVYLLFV
jgi:phosphatidate cytidylyltransferase